MPGNPREMITTAGRTFPSASGLRFHPEVSAGAILRSAWLDEDGGSDGWALTPSGIRGVLNDAVSLYFADAALARAFVARWCVGSEVETAGGAFQVRQDEPPPRVGAGLHSTP
jgi:hypothetical protein